MSIVPTRNLQIGKFDLLVFPASYHMSEPVEPVTELLPKTKDTQKNKAETAVQHDLQYAVLPPGGIPY